jgi:signal transduction histidine kinase
MDKGLPSWIDGDGSVGHWPSGVYWPIGRCWKIRGSAASTAFGFTSAFPFSTVRQSDDFQMTRPPPPFPRSQGRKFARLFVPARVLWVAPVLLLEFSAAAEALTRIADIRLLPRDKAATAMPVRVRGVVTWRNGRDNITVQDDSAGIWVSFSDARSRQIWKSDSAILDRIREGTEVEIAGRSDPGGYAPLILPESLKVIGVKELPAAKPIKRARFFSGADDCQRVEVRAVVQGIYPAADEVTLIMDANPGRFIARIASAVAKDPAALVDAEVLLRGVAGTHFNTRGEATGIRVVTSRPDDLVVEKPPPPPDAVPWVALDRLLPFRADPIGPHRVRVEGTVTYALPGRFFYLQEGESAVRVETPSNLALQAGDRVEAAGFVEISRLIGTLCDATVRKTGAASLPEPVAISPLEILALNKVAVETAQVALPHDYDGHLIRCRAQLLAVQSEPDGRRPHTLTLEQPAKPGQGSLIFRALLHDGKSTALDSLKPGSELEVTGLVQLDYAPNDLPSRIARTVPANLDLILRSPADVVILTEPPWWTARHLAAVLAAVLLALGGALVWNLQLKRQVRRKTRQLAREIHARHDAAIEFQATLRERTRLAANLHDTLLQTMSGLGFQIEACEAEVTPQPNGKPPGHLEVARRMVDHAVDELRNSVWALRSLPLNGMGLPEALESVAHRLGAGRDVRIKVSTDGDLSRVPDFIAGNLILIVQEALHNSLKHGNPRSVIVEIRTLENPARIVLTVQDDGAGFTPGEQVGVAQGHFGLQGMRERMERLDGTLRIQSAPGHGTTLRAEAPLRIYDGELAERPIDDAGHPT